MAITLAQLLAYLMDPKTKDVDFQLTSNENSVANSDFTMSLQADQNVPTLAIKVPTFSVD